MATQSAERTIERTPGRLWRVIVFVVVVLVILLFLRVAVRYAKQPQAQGWEALRSPFDGTINTLLVEDPDGVRVMYAGTEGGVFKSTDQGEHWAACNNGLTDRLVRSLIMDPENPRNLYAGTWSGKVFVTRDGGSSWEELNPLGSRTKEIRDLAVNPHLSGQVYALGAADVLTITQSDAQWHPASVGIQEATTWDVENLTGTLQSMAMDPEHPTTLYVGTTGLITETGIYSSTDGGRTWHSLHTGIKSPGIPTTFTNVSALAMSPRAPGTIYAIGEAGGRSGKVLKTLDWGVTWAYMDSFRDEAEARCITLDPRDPAIVYVGLNDGIYKSTDGRRSWAPSDTGPQGPSGRDVRVVVVDPLDTNIVYACADNQLFMSKDAGATWALRSAIYANSQAKILALKADPKDGETFYASVEGGGLYKTDDRGDTWKHVGKALPAKQMTAIDLDPVSPTTVYVGHTLGDQGLVSTSTYGGAKWADPPAVWVASAPISVVVVDPERPQRIYAGTRGQGLYYSNDGGQNWVSYGTDIGTDIKQVVLNTKESPASVWVVSEKGVFKGTETEWQLWGSPVAWIVVVPPVKSSLKPQVISAESIVGVSEKDQVIVLGKPEGTRDNELVVVATTPAAPEALFALIQGKGVYRMAYLGQPWVTWGSGLQSLKLKALAISPDDANLILVGTEQGIYRYQLDKTTWDDIQRRWEELPGKAKAGLERLKRRIVGFIR